MEANLHTPEVAGNGIEKVTDAVRERLATARTKAAEGYEKVAAKAHEAWDKAADTTIHDVQASAIHYVRRNPGKSLLMAAGVGLAVGLLLRGRR